MRFLHPILRTGLAVSALIAALPWARAQTPSSTADEIAALRAQIQALDRQVLILERRQELREENSPGRVTLNDRGLTVASPDAANSLRIRGLTQLDSRVFLNDGGIVNNAFVLRRARLIAEGVFAKSFSYQIVPEFGGGTVSLVDANLAVALSPRLQLRVGRFKAPVGLELLQSDSWTFFSERSLVTNLVPNRDLGVQASGDLFANRLSYSVGLFNGVPDGGSTNNSDFDEGKTAAGRLYAAPFRTNAGSPLQGLAFGVSGTVGREKTAAGRASAYRTDGQQTFFAYNAATVSDGLNWRVSPQAEFRRGPLGLLGEYVVSTVNLRPTATGPKAELRNKAWQVAAGYVLTGEASAYAGVVPATNFDRAARTWGAFEVVARYATLDIDDAAFPTFASASASAAQARSYGVGLNWYLSKAVRANVDYFRTEFDLAPGGAPASTAVIANDEDLFLTRFQVSF